MLAAIRASTPSKNSCVGEVGEGWKRGGQGHCGDSHTYDAMHKYKQDVNEYDKLHFSFSDMQSKMLPIDSSKMFCFFHYNSRTSTPGTSQQLASVILMHIHYPYITYKFNVMSVLM